MYRVIHQHDFWIKTCETSLFYFGIFLVQRKISERKSKDNIYHRKKEVFFLFILMLNFFLCHKSALQSGHTFPMSFFYQVVVKTFSWNICLRVVEINFFQFQTVQNTSGLFHHLFGEICSLNIISLKKMSNSCWKDIVVWFQMMIFFCHLIDWNLYMSFWHLCVCTFLFFSWRGHGEEWLNRNR